jgi:hypothetical protein
MTDEHTPLPAPGRQELEGRQCLSADDRRRLRELAEAASLESPGPWRIGAGPSECLCEDGIIDARGDAVFVNCGRVAGTPPIAAEEYMVAAHPGLVLSLLDENDALKINVEGAHAWLDEAAGPDHSDHTPDGLRLRVEGLVKRLDAAEADRDGWKAEAEGQHRLARQMKEERDAARKEAAKLSALNTQLWEWRTAEQKETDSLLRDLNEARQERAQMATELSRLREENAALRGEAR